MNATAVKGFACGALAAASYGLNPLFTLPLYKAGLDADSVLFYRYGLAVVMLYVLMKVKRQSLALKKAEIVPLIILGILFAISSLTLFMSYNYMDAGIASTILFVYPVMVAVLMAVFFHEKLTLLTLSSITLAFVGISMLYQTGNGQTLSPVGVVLVLISSLTYAIYIIGVNRSVLRDTPTAKLTFYAVLFGWSVFFVRLRFGMHLDIITEPVLWLNPVCLALFPTIISLIFMTKSIHYIGSTPAAILGALEPLTAVCIGVAVFGEQLTPRIVTGIILILIAVTLIIAGKSLIHTIQVHMLHK